MRFSGSGPRLGPRAFFRGHFRACRAFFPDAEPGFRHDPPQEFKTIGAFRMMMNAFACINPGDNSGW
jgi:hypothetical protein